MLKKEINLKSHSFFRTGGHCRYFFAPCDIENAKQALKQIASLQLPFFVLGAGSNSLLSDERYEGSVLSLQHMRNLTLTQSGVWAEAGVLNSDLALFAYENELAGAAWMFHLPGQIGGTVRMNARCYGGEVSQIVDEVHALDPKSGQLIKYQGETARTIFRGYKDTSFMKNAEIIVKAHFLLPKGNKQELKTKMVNIANDRNRKQQFVYPNCGCIFKNDYSPEVSVSSGLLLELAGAKNFRQKGAVVNPKHANFVFNMGATSTDILQLSFQMREAVYQEFGVWLEYEMEILGSLSKELAAMILEKRPKSFKIERLAEARAIFAKKS